MLLLLRWLSPYRRAVSLRPERMMILAELRRGGSASGQIAERVGLNEGLVEPVLFLLVSQGLVERKRRPAASAPPLYQITPEGARLLDATGGAERPWDEES